MNNIEILKKWLSKTHHLGEKSEDFGDRIVYCMGDSFRVMVQRPGTKSAGFKKDYPRTQIEDATDKELEEIAEEILNL